MYLVYTYSIVCAYSTAKTWYSSHLHLMIFMNDAVTKLHSSRTKLGIGLLPNPPFFVRVGLRPPTSWWGIYYYYIVKMIILDNGVKICDLLLLLGKSKVIEGHLKKLKDQLIVLQGIPSESEETKASKLKMTQTAFKSFMKTGLDMGVDVQTIQRALENLLTKNVDIVIDGDLYQWCYTELERQNAIHNPESPYLQQISSQPLNEVNFDKEVLQNSLVACHLLQRSQFNGEEMAYLHSLHELNISMCLHLERSVNYGKGELLESFTTSSLESTSSSKGTSQLTESSRSGAPSYGSVHQYLIAKGAYKPNGHVIYYLAFGSHQSLREWSESHTSFEEGNYCM